MSDLLDRVKNEPVVTAALVTAIVGVAAYFGFDVKPDVVALILLGLGFVSAGVARSRVTPVDGQKGA